MVWNLHDVIQNYSKYHMEASKKLNLSQQLATYLYANTNEIPQEVDAAFLWIVCDTNSPAISTATEAEIISNVKFTKRGTEDFYHDDYKYIINYHAAGVGAPVITHAKLVKN